MRRRNAPLLLLSALLLSTAQAADSRLVDLTHAYDSNTVFWPTADGFELEVDFKGTTPAGFYYEANRLRTAEHGGTHLDAPVHFAAGRQHADEPIRARANAALASTRAPGRISAVALRI